jgi:hypothetical protein
VLSRSREQAERIRAYDSEIAYTDRHVGDLIQALITLQLRERTLVVVTADHGESLGENDYVGHSDRIDQPIVHIPLIFAFPGIISGGQVVTEDASLLDVMPTLLDYAGLPIRIPIEGRSLKALMGVGGLVASERAAYFLTYTEPPLLPPRWLSWIWTWAKTKLIPSRLGFADGELKFVLDGEMRYPRVYRLDALAKLEVPIHEPDAEMDAHRSRLNHWLERTNRGLEPKGKLSQEDIEMLRSIGYTN